MEGFYSWDLCLLWGITKSFFLEGYHFYPFPSWMCSEFFDAEGDSDAGEVQAFSSEMSVVGSIVYVRDSFAFWNPTLFTSWMSPTSHLHFHDENTFLLYHHGNTRGFPLSEKFFHRGDIYFPNYNFSLTSPDFPL